MFCIGLWYDCKHSHDVTLGNLHDIIHFSKRCTIVATEFGDKLMEISVSSSLSVSIFSYVFFWFLFCLLFLTEYILTEGIVLPHKHIPHNNFSSADVFNFIKLKKKLSLVFLRI